MRRSCFALLAIGAFLSTFAIVRPESPLAQSGLVADATYSDPTGDATNGAPDLTTFRVSDSNRTITFSVGVRGIPTPETRVDIYFNVDRNASTGDTDGDEYWLILDGENLSRRALRWNGSAWVSWSPSSRRGGYQNGVWTESINASDLNGTSGFIFQLYGVRLKDDQNAGSDGTSRYTYVLGQQPPPPPPPTPTKRLAITTFTGEPSRPVAGESFTVSVTVQRVGWSGRFRGSVYCGATIAGRKLRPFGSPGRGRAACRWDIPATAAGKTLAGVIGVSEGDALATRRFSARVLRRAMVLSNVGVTMSPSRGPEAGKQFKYEVAVSIRSGSGTPSRITTGTVSCKATVGGKALRVFEQRLRVLIGIRCGWEIPFDAAGQTMTGTIVVRSQGATLTHQFTRRIR